MVLPILTVLSACPRTAATILVASTTDIQVPTNVLARSNRHDAVAHDEAAHIGESIAVACVREFTAQADSSPIQCRRLVVTEAT